MQTTRLLAQELGWPNDHFVTTFQSKFGPAEWVSPSTVGHVSDLAKDDISSIAIISPAFCADCVETLEEVEGEIQDAFMQAGGKEFLYVPCLNDGVAHVEMLASIVNTELSGWM